MTVVAVLPASSCSSNTPAEGSAPTPAIPSTASPSAPRTPPSETSLERRTRLDQEAAVKAYRAALPEIDRLFNLGGVNEPTAKLSLLTTGAYLKFMMRNLRLLKKKKWHGEGETRIVFAQAQESSSNVMHVKACEDISQATIVNQENRRQVSASESFYIQDYTVVRTADGFKISDVTTKRVKSLKPYGCHR